MCGEARAGCTRCAWVVVTAVRSLKLLRREAAAIDPLVSRRDSLESSQTRG